MPRSLKVDVELVRIGKRHRDLNAPAVDRLAQSMHDIGLRQPITIRVVDNHVDDDGEITDGVSILVAGRHRLEAARKLGWEYIDAVDADDDEIQAELWEIAENLHRLDLTKEQRDRHIRRYAELLKTQAKDLQSRQSVAIDSKREDGKGHRPQGVASQVADETGLSVRTVQRALKSSQPASEPLQQVHDVHEQARRRMMSAWNAATEEDRQWFMEWIDVPVLG